MKPDDELHDKIDRIRSVFHIEGLISKKIEMKDIQRYYRINKIFYRIFHNSYGFVHMGISRNGQYRDEDVLEQPKLAARYIKELNAEKVLELGTGKGASSIYLAKEFPTVKFYGIDLPDGQLDVAKRKANQVKNFYPLDGDYHDLSRFEKDEFDVIFIFEALCHSDTKWLVARETHRVLKPGGIFIIADGYLGEEKRQLTKTELLAIELTGKGMSVNDFESYPAVRTIMLDSGFEIIFEEDVSDFTLPNVSRYEQMAAKAVFNHPAFGHWFVKIFPQEFSFNAISGYLMPLVIKMGIARYYLSVFRKKIP
jgi:arsenite methyltransferase